jgi:hypothetical protein
MRIILFNMGLGVMDIAGDILMGSQIATKVLILIKG